MTWADRSNPDQVVIDLTAETATWRQITVPCPVDAGFTYGDLRRALEAAGADLDPRYFSSRRVNPPGRTP